MGGKRRRLGVLPGAVFLAACSAWACDALDGAPSKGPTGAECAPTTSGAARCEGAVCLQLAGNAQGKAGICSQSCTGTECGVSGICLDIGGGSGACFRLCQSDAGCLDHFACVRLEDGSGRGVCYVTAGGTGDLPDSGGPDVGFTPPDGDGHTYPTVVIGSQRWMAANLNATRYRDGAPVPEVADPTEWRLLEGPGRCDYDNTVGHTGTYGRLYNWHAVATGLLCPAGWHVPSDAEWSTLEAFLGEASLAGGRLKEAGTARWWAPNTAATNDTGFTGLPGGSRFSTGSFYNLAYDGYWWSSTTGSDPAYGLYRWLDFNSGFFFRSEDYKLDGLSVRCLQD